MKKIFKNINPFVFNGGIGRVAFLLTIFTSFVLSVVSLLITVVISEGFPQYIWINKPYSIICIALVLYISVLAYMKRVHDIIDNKAKAVLYVVLFYIVTTCLAFFQNKAVSIINLILSIIVIGSLLLVPGKNK